MNVSGPWFDSMLDSVRRDLRRATTKAEVIGTVRKHDLSGDRRFIAMLEELTARHPQLAAADLVEAYTILTSLPLLEEARRAAVTPRWRPLVELVHGWMVARYPTMPPWEKVWQIMGGADDERAVPEGRGH